MISVTETAIYSGFGFYYQTQKTAVNYPFYSRERQQNRFKVAVNLPYFVAPLPDYNLQKKPLLERFFYFGSELPFYKKSSYKH